jgi:hypothetical protein
MPSVLCVRPERCENNAGRLTAGLRRQQTVGLVVVEIGRYKGGWYIGTADELGVELTCRRAVTVGVRGTVVVGVELFHGDSSVNSLVK